MMVIKHTAVVLHRTPAGVYSRVATAVHVCFLRSIHVVDPLRLGKLCTRLVLLVGEKRIRIHSWHALLGVFFSFIFGLALCLSVSSPKNEGRATPTNHQQQHHALLS